MNLLKNDDRIFIAGHNGMVGSAIKRSFLKKGFNNLLTASREKLNLLDKNQVDKWFKKEKPNIVILAAAKVGGIGANSKFPVEFLLENLKIQNNVIEASWKNDVRRFLFLGSSCIYPKFANQPISESQLLQGRLESTNESYALAKIAGIKLCQALRKQYNFDAISLMPTNLYGPGDNYHKENSHVLPAFIIKFFEAYISGHKDVQCWGSGSPLREFLHVDDLADACLFALENWSPNFPNAPLDECGEPISWLNVGTGKEISIKELANMISSQIGFPGKTIWDETKPDGTPRKLLDISLIRSIGWEPKISLKEGIKSTIDEFKLNYYRDQLRK